MMLDLSKALLFVVMMSQCIGSSIEGIASCACEGTTRLCLVLMPLIWRIQAAIESIQQIWYADNASMAGL